MARRESFDGRRGRDCRGGVQSRLLDLRGPAHRRLRWRVGRSSSTGPRP